MPLPRTPVNKVALVSIVGARTAGEVHRGVADDGSQQRKPGFKPALEDVKALATVLAMEVESALGRRTAQVLGLLALLAVVVVLLFLVLNWYVAPTKPSERKDLILAVAQILGGTALLSGLYFTWRTLQVNREGQITERFTRAIDQLGKVEDGQKQFEIRIGGIYALERIAKESEKDYWPIMEILTTYVRRHAPLGPEQDQEGEEHAAVERSEEDSGATTWGADPTEVPTPNPDIQSIMTVLRRRTRFYKHGEPEPLDLHETNLRGATLRGANLGGADLREASLIGADLEGSVLKQAKLRKAKLGKAKLLKAALYKVDFREANLYQADLREVNLQEAELQGAEKRDPHNYQDPSFGKATLREVNFKGADLSGANLRRGILYGADLTRANLKGADLQQTDLTEAVLYEADLREANLGGTNLEKARLRGAKLQGASLRRASLRQAKLQEAKLQEADLEGADLRHAELPEVNLEGANLTGANLERANLSGAKLQNADVTEVQLAAARSLLYATMPDGSEHS
jgi:uncharacterized protein YjbI with pentapeptide repeats